MNHIHNEHCQHDHDHEHDHAHEPTHMPYRAAQKVGRNDPCPCHSGQKFKKCCGNLAR